MKGAFSLYFPFYTYLPTLVFFFSLPISFCRVGVNLSSLPAYGS